jgi:phosphotransferase system  glucose/maltose/N-acetylglucosamine-specific IIC component
MSLQETLLGMLTVAGGIVIGTILTWIVSYFIGKRTLPRLLKSLSNDPEVMNMIKSLKEKLETRTK